MILDDLIRKASLNSKEAVVLKRLLKHKPVDMNELVRAIQREVRKSSYTGKDPKNYTRRNVRNVIVSLNSKMAVADTGYVIVKTSGLGRGVTGVYELRQPKEVAEV